MNSLLTIDKATQEPLLDSRVAARVLGLEHESILKLLKQHQVPLELEYSELKSEKTERRGQPARFALLTERQALLLITMVRNTEESLALKSKLVDAFLEMRSALLHKTVGKAVRLELTDAIQQAKEAGLLDMHGHEYKNFTDLIYRAVLGMTAKQFREVHGLAPDASIVGHLTLDQAGRVQILEKAVCGMIPAGFPFQTIKQVIEARSLPVMVAQAIERATVPANLS